MADIHLAPSTYDTGTNDTFTTLVDATDDVLAVHQNGPASAIVAVETILGTGTTLKGSAADLATRLGVAHEASGKLSDFSATTKDTFPGTVAEGCTGATSFTASQVIRKHATNDVLEATGYTVPGSSGVLVSEGDTQTLTNKTLSAPTIGDLSNMTHGHTGASTGGILTGNASTGTDAAWSGGVSNDVPVNSSASVTISTQTGAKVLIVASAFMDADVDNFSVNQPYLLIRRDTTELETMPLSTASVSLSSPTVVSLTTVDAPSAGTYTYYLSINRAGGGSATNFSFTDVSISVFAVV